MVSEKVRPRMMGKGTNQETVTRKMDSKHERETKGEWGGRRRAVRTAGEDMT